jgi:hypothetical protein
MSSRAAAPMWPGTTDSLGRRPCVKSTLRGGNAKGCWGINLLVRHGSNKAAYTAAEEAAKTRMAQVAKSCPRSAPEGP